MGKGRPASACGGGRARRVARGLGLGAFAVLLACAKGGLVEDNDNGLSGAGPTTTPPPGVTEDSGAVDGGETAVDTTGEADSTEGGDAPDPLPPEEPSSSSEGGEETGEDPDPLPPAPPGCGNAVLEAGEQCDDGNAVDGDACVHCQDARCGDGVRYAAVEECDDGNGDDHDACLDSCAMAICGDGILRDDTEVCDDGNNDGAYGGCMPDCSALAAYCGDGDVDASEMCDPEEQLPYDNVECDDDSCLFDFGGIPQLYCYGSCSWGGLYGCDEFEADILCKLTTGDAGSTATDWDLAYALDAPGFACPGFGVDMGAMPQLGVAQHVYYQDFSVLATHGAGAVIVNPSCT